MSGRGRADAATETRVRARGRSQVPVLVALAFAAVAGFVVLVAGPAYPQDERGYRFVKVADSVEDGLDPDSFGCAALNDRGDVAFRAGRLTPDGFNTINGIYRVDAADGRLVTIAENERRFDFLGRNPSINDGGQVSFAAVLDREDPRTGNNVEEILRGAGGGLTTIASTEDRFNFFGFDTSVNNGGRVAFKAELDERFGFDEGLFSGRGGGITTHYLASTSRFDGTDTRPSINTAGDIAFEERRNDEQGIFVTRGDGFRTIAEADPDGFVSVPVLNDEGTVAFHTSFTDEATGEPVTEIVTGNGGPLTTVADTRGPFAFFDPTSPSLNNAGEVAFRATLDDFTTTGIFVGPKADRDRVIATDERLDGSTVRSLAFCQEGLNDSGRLAFVAQLRDPDAPDGSRTAVFRARPVR